MKNRWLLGWILVWMGSLGLRGWYGMATKPFSQDQARDVMLMEQYDANGVNWVTLGPKASVGDVYLPPWFYQIHLWLAKLSHHHPLAMLWYSIIIESFTPLVVGLIVFQLTKQNLPSILAASIYSLSPMIISNAANSWNPTTLPFFTSLFVLTNLWYVAKRNRMAFVGVWFSYLMLLNLHFQSWILFPLVIIITILALWRRDFITILGTTVFTIVLSLPYLIGDINHHWQNTDRIFSLITAGQSTQEPWHPEKFIFMTIPNLFNKLLFPLSWHLNVYGYVSLIGGLGSIGYLALKKRSISCLWISIIVVEIILGFSLYRGYIHDYYLSLLFVFPTIFWGILLSWKKIQPITFLLTLGLIGSFIISLVNQKLVSQYDSYRALVNRIVDNNPGQTIKLWLSNNDERPPLEYLLTKRGIKAIEDQADSLVVVCSGNALCRLDTYLTNNQFSEESIEAIEAKNPYRLSTMFNTNTHQVLLGKLK